MYSSTSSQASNTRIFLWMYEIAYINSLEIRNFYIVGSAVLEKAVGTADGD